MMSTMVSLWRLMGLGLVVAVSQGLEKPATLPTEGYGGEIGVKGTVGGTECGFALKPFWPESFSVSGTGKPTKVTLGEKTLGPIVLNHLTSEELPEDADGVLGQDALRRVTLVFDTVEKTLRVVSQTKISQSRAESLLNDLPSWGGLGKIVRIPLKRTPGGVPTIATTIGGEPATLMLRLSFEPSDLDASVSRPKEGVLEDAASYLPRTLLGGFASPWVAYASREAWASSEEKEGAGGRLSLGAFPSRRVVVDLAGDAVYVEDLPEEAKLSLILSQQTGLPVVVEDGRLVVGHVPGDEEVALPYPKGSEVRSIAGVKASEWLDDLRLGTDEAAMRMARRMIALGRDFTISLRMADGTIQEVTVPHDPPPTPPASPRAGARVRAGSWSR